MRRFYGSLVAMSQRHPRMTDAALALGLLGIGVLSLVASRSSLGQPERAWDYLWMTLLVAPVFLWRRQPLVSLALMLAVLVPFSLLNVPGSGAETISVFVAIVGVGRYVRYPHRDIARWSGLIAFLTLLAYMIVVTGPGDGVKRTLTLAAATVVVNVVFYLAAWRLGDTLRERHERADALAVANLELQSQRLEIARAAVLEERVRIARELHDVVAHHVSVMGVQAGAARRVIERRPELAVQALSAIEQASRNAVAEMHRLLGFLRAEGEVDAIDPQPTLERLPDLLAKVRDAGLGVDLVLDGTADQVPSGVQLSAYRIVQEALTNSLKHAGPAHAVVRLARTDHQLTVVVEDDGRGAAAARPDIRSAGGNGLLGMRERAALLNGSVSAGPRPGGGWIVRAVFPLTNGSAA